MKTADFTAFLVASLTAGCGAAVVRDPTGVAPIASPMVRVEAMPAASLTPQPSAPPPTWTALFAAYFGAGSPGSCGRAGRCHADEMRDASSAYDWLARRGYIDGTRSALVDPSNSCLRWFGGNMPPQPQPADDATRDLQAWVAAGAPDD
ncbi:MAG TPA: hypothetical protein VF765_05345 [Polyangiaceae bacterium]